MGSSMTLFIEYDMSEYYNPNCAVQPFSDGNYVWSLTHEEGLYVGKDYLFFAAIAGVRNRSKIKPLYPPRGVPTVMSPPVRMFFENDPSTPDDAGWLTLTEIHKALDYMKVDEGKLSFETQTHLATMAYIERRLGKDRVRLVFAGE
jgi:hypothetical protein